VINGIKVLFSDGRNEAAYIFIAGQDTEQTVVDLTVKLAEDGWKPVSSTLVVHDGRGWVRRETEPTLRQLLGMRPAWKLA
jgi:hypothetical protein